MAAVHLKGMRWEWIFQLGCGSLLGLFVGGSLIATMRGIDIEGAGLGVVFVLALIGIMALIRLHSTKLRLEASGSHVRVQSMFRSQQVTLDRLKSAQLKPDKPAKPGGWGVGPTWAVLRLEDHDSGHVELEMPLQVGPKEAEAQQRQVWRWVADALDASDVEVGRGLAVSLATFAGPRQGESVASLPVPPDTTRAAASSEAAKLAYASFGLAAIGLLFSYMGFMASLVGAFGLIQGIRTKAPWWVLALNGVGIVAGILVRAAGS